MKCADCGKKIIIDPAIHNIDIRYTNAEKYEICGKCFSKYKLTFP